MTLDLSLLDTPPLRVRQKSDELAAALQLPFVAVAALVLKEPTLLAVEPEELQSRYRGVLLLQHEDV